MRNIMKDSSGGTCTFYEKKRRPTENGVIFGVAFFVGVAWITLLARGKTPENTLLNLSLQAAFLEQGWNRKMLFAQCLYSRGIFVFLIMLLAHTSFRKLIFRMVSAWIGLSLGILCKLFFCWYGLWGIGLLLVCTLPHFLIYWMAYGLLYWERERSRVHRAMVPVGMLVVAGVVIIGMVMESYVNPIFVRAYLKIFFS